MKAFPLPSSACRHVASVGSPSPLHLHVNTVCVIFKQAFVSVQSDQQPAITPSQALI